MKPTLNLPNRIRTKAEAQRLATEIFPDTKAALQTLKAEKPDCALPRYYLRYGAAERLREVFTWLFDRDTRIYKRARWHLFYNLAERLINQMEENGSAKTSEIYAERTARKWKNRVAAWWMTGDGEGI